MKRLIYSKNALDDFDSILEYIARDNPPAAVQFGEGFIEACELIAQQPEIGIRRGSKNSTQRMFTFRGYAIFYRNLDHVVRIQRFLHPSLDVEGQSLD